MASEWDLHKETIQNLYSDKGMPLKDVIAIMERSFQFYASKSGYERQLRKWGLQKNQRASDMKFLKIRLEQRRQQKKESHVLVKGVLLPKLEIEKKTARCHISLLEQYELERCATPDGVTVITPTSDAYMDCVRSRDLPWIYTLRQLPSIRSLNMFINMPPQTLRVLIPAVCPISSRTIQGQMERNFYHLSSILPVKRDEDIYSILHHIVGTDGTSATVEMLKLAVYLLSNNLLDDGSESNWLICDELLKWFQMGDNIMILKDILSHRLPTLEAFAEGIFASALNVQDRQFVRIFLDSGGNPNILIYDRTSEDKGHCTPLQFASKIRNFGIIELLLKFDVDVDKIVEWGDETPLGIAASNGDMEIAQLLISRGAAVNVSTRRSDTASPLQLAASGGHTELAKMLLDQGVNINLASGDLERPLGCAIHARAADLIEMFLERGADIGCEDEGDESGEWSDAKEQWRFRKTITPLQSAARVDDHEMVLRLLQMGANINAYGRSESGSGRTALEWATENENVHLCQVLLIAGADPNIGLGRKARGALKIAVSSGNQQIVQVLLEHGAEVNNPKVETTLLEVAAGLNDTAMTRLLLSAGADPTLGDPLILAIEMQNHELISLLSAAGAKINAKGRNGELALRQAVERQDLNLVRLLLEAGVDPDLGTPLVHAATLGNLEIIEILLGAGAGCNTQYAEVGIKRVYYNLNALQTAAATRNIDLVRYLLVAGADLNYPAASCRGQTALQAAVASQNYELVQFLIDEGADLNSPAAAVGSAALQAAIDCRDEALVRMLLMAGAHANDAPAAGNGLNAIQLAAACGDDGLICLLLDNGADINAPPADKSGSTALQAAAGRGHNQTVLLLLAKGAHVNGPISRNHGRNALFAASLEGYLHIADVLLKAGADVNAVSTYHWGGHTALEAAAGKGRIDMLKLLLNAGADITSDFGRSQLKNALERATRYGHDAAAKFLKYHQIC